MPKVTVRDVRGHLGATGGTRTVLVLLVRREELEGGRPWLALALLSAFVVTAVTGVLVRADPDRLLSTQMILAELAVGFALLAGDDWSFAGPHPQSLGSVWPIAGVLTAGLRWGGRGGAIAGAVVGLGGIFAALVEAGYAVVKLREAEREISMAPGRRRRREVRLIP